MADYFGRPWPSGICEDEGARRVRTPVGRKCWYCHTRIWPGQQGSFIYGPKGLEPQHKECSLRSVVGGIFHLRGECRHVGHCEELRERHGLSLRTDAKLAFAFFQQYGMSRSSFH